LLDVKSDGIKKMDCVASTSEPQGMDASGAANVENRCGRTSEISIQDVLGAVSLELSNAAQQPLGLLDLSIMLEHLRRK
jgi:hypothetical protein